MSLGVWWGLVLDKNTARVVIRGPCHRVRPNVTLQPCAASLPQHVKIGRFAPWIMLWYTMPYAAGHGASA